MTFSTEQIDALKAPLSRDSVKTRSQSGRSLSYIEGWKAIAEANRIFGFDAWTRETLDISKVAEHERPIGQSGGKGWGVTYIARVRIRVGDITRDGCGTGHGIDRDLGQAHESALKEAETDAMKRALMTFGNPFGLALYDKEQAEVEDAPRTATQKAAQPQTPASAPSIAPTPAAPLTPALWLEESAKAVKTMDRIQLDDFTTKQADRMARVRTLNPGLHDALVKAIQARQQELF